MPEHLAPFSGTSQWWALLRPRRHLPERTRNSASTWEQGGEWAGWAGLGMTKGTGRLLWSLRLASFLLSDECWNLKYRGQDYLGKCFHYSMIKLMAQEEGTGWRGFRLSCLGSCSCIISVKTLVTTCHRCCPRHPGRETSVAVIA